MADYGEGQNPLIRGQYPGQTLERNQEQIATRMILALVYQDIYLETNVEEYRPQLGYGPCHDEPGALAD